MHSKSAKESKETTPLPNRGGVVCSIGFFDGVHRGHQCLIRQVRDEALRRGMRSLLITFDCHPRSVFAPAAVPLLLTPAKEKMELLKATGVDDIYVLPFDAKMAALTAKEFMQRVLKEQLGVEVLVIGYDHRFGRPLSDSPRGGEGFHEYQEYGREVGIEVVLAKELEGEHVSSSAIRRALEAGDVEKANHLLGRPYAWTGRVVHGHEVGRQLGFPTANLEAMEPTQLLPARGAYAICIEDLGLRNDEYKQTPNCIHQSSIINHQSSSLTGMLNIGRRPTLDNGTDTSIEAHLFDFNGDLYDRTLTLSFIARLRAERRFDSEEELAEQLRRDKKACLSLQKKRSWWVYVVMFFISQLVGGGAAVLLSSAVGLSGVWSLMMSLLVANLLAIGLFLLWKPYDVTWATTMAGVHGRKGRRTGLVFLMALPIIVLVNLIQEAFFPDLPDLVGEEMFRAIMGNPLGMVTVAMLGPLAEELLFRGGVQKDLQTRYVEQGPAVAIALSATLFAMAHMNPAQMPAAFILGLVLGFAFWWTGSLAAPICIHVFNNSLACFLLFLSPDDDSLIHFLGGKEQAGVVAVVCVFFLVIILHAVRKEAKKGMEKD